MTGAYFRVNRNGEWMNVELEHMTPDEIREKFTGENIEFTVSCLNLLAEQLRLLEPLLDGLVADGILERKDRP